MTTSPARHVSVAIPTFNGRRYLDACIQSLQDQDYPRDRYEIFLFDNGSSDGSADYVQQHYPDVRIVRLGRNYGCTEAGNRMVAYVQSPYLAIFNQDAVAHRSWLSELMHAIENDPQAKLVHSNTIFPWWPENACREREKLVERAYVCDLNAFGMVDWRPVPVSASTAPIPTLACHMAGAVLDRSVADELGYVGDPYFFCYADDVDLALRINSLGYKVLFVPKSVVYHATEWKVKLSRHTLRKAMWSTRNNFLCFYKLSYPMEYAVLLPLLVLGNLFKATQHALSPWLKPLYVLAAIPQTLLALAAAFIKLPFYGEMRRKTLGRRVTPRWWLVRELMSRSWRSEPGIWNAEPRRSRPPSLSQDSAT